VFGVLFIFLVLASLYESFVTPLTIMLALPLAFCGSMVALAITQESLNIFSMIGVIMLLGVAVKNSILLVDYANQLIDEGMDRTEAMIKAGKTRLRPILMTSLALIAGTIPIAIGLNEASKQRTSMGIAIIGGLVSSTLLTLVVVPASFSFIDRFRIWSGAKLREMFGTH
jgi:HAE1 family hydrophobic/amphiphilic exporter-1